MNTETAKILCKLNNDFYRSHADSFSETRKAPWEGWKQALCAIEEDVFQSKTTVNILDVACGNLRFVEFLSEAYPMVEYEGYAVDDCDDLVPEKPRIHFQNLDIIDTLLKGGSLIEAIEAPPCDLTVCFGFMHHVPSVNYRKEILDALIEKTQVGGYIIVSFWEFLNSDELATKAQHTHEQACHELQLPPLDEGDYLLGWKNTPGAYRYCHSFSESEITNLLAGTQKRAHVVTRFLADGRSGNLNSYVVLRRVL